MESTAPGRRAGQRKSMEAEVGHLAGNGTAAAIINVNDPKGADLAVELSAAPSTPAILAAGNGAAADIRPTTCTTSGTGMSVTLATPSGLLDIRSPLVGSHNLENVMSAVGVGLHLEIPLDTIRQGVASLPAVPGRLL